jgi:hypothetical protein
MKKLIQIISVFAFAVIFSVVSASAQSAPKIKTNIPFDFKISEKSYQTGNYEFSIVGTAAGNAILIMRDSSGKNLNSIVINRTDSGKINGSELTFRRYNDEHFLVGIVFGNGSYSLIQSSAEKDAVKNSKTNLAGKRHDAAKGM